MYSTSRGNQPVIYDFASSSIAVDTATAVVVNAHHSQHNKAQKLLLANNNNHDPNRRRRRRRCPTLTQRIKSLVGHIMSRGSKVTCDGDGDGADSDETFFRPGTTSFPVLDDPYNKTSCVESWSIYILEELWHPNHRGEVVDRQRPPVVSTLWFRLVENDPNLDDEEEAAPEAMYLKGEEIVQALQLWLQEGGADDPNDDVYFYVFPSAKRPPFIMNHWIAANSFFHELLKQHQSSSTDPYFFPYYPPGANDYHSLLAVMQRTIQKQQFLERYTQWRVHPNRPYMTSPAGGPIERVRVPYHDTVVRRARRRQPGKHQRRMITTTTKTKRTFLYPL